VRESVENENNVEAITVDLLIMHIFMQHAEGVPFKGVHPLWGIL